MTTWIVEESPSIGRIKIDNTLLISTTEPGSSVALKIESNCEVEAATETKIRTKINVVKLSPFEGIHHHRMLTNEINRADNSLSRLKIK